MRRIVLAAAVGVLVLSGCAAPVDREASIGIVANGEGASACTRWEYTTLHYPDTALAVPVCTVLTIADVPHDLHWSQAVTSIVPAGSACLESDSPHADRIFVVEPCRWTTQVPPRSGSNRAPWTFTVEATAP